MLRSPPSSIVARFVHDLIQTCLRARAVLVFGPFGIDGVGICSWILVRGCALFVMFGVLYQYRLHLFLSFVIEVLGTVPDFSGSTLV